MELVGLSVLLAGALGVAGFALVRRRQAKKARRRAEEKVLEERVSARLAELMSERSGRRGEPVRAPDGDKEAAPISELPVDTKPSSIGRLGGLEPAAEAGGVGSKRRVIARDAVAVAAITAVLLLLASQLPLNLPPQTAVTATLTSSPAPPTATPDLLTPTPQTTPKPGASPTPTAALETPTPTPLPTPPVYVVRPGDTMTAIARAFGVTLAELIAANPQIEDPSLIYAGNEIVIPTPGP